MPVDAHGPEVAGSPAAELSALEGVIPILVTPFAPDDSVDLEQMDSQIEFLIGVGVRWVGLGFGSEVPRLGADELRTTMEHVVEKAAGRLGVVGNAEMTSVAAGAEAVRRVRDAGAQLAMVRPSALEWASQDVLYSTFSAVAELGGLPIVVQDAPQNTGVQLAPATLARLMRDAEGVAAVKIEPPGPAPKMSLIKECLDGADGVVIGGAGGLDYLHELQRGARGTMPGPAYPELFAAVHRLHDDGDRKQAFTLFSRALPLINLCQRDMDTFLFVQKYVLTQRGVLAGARLRQPHRPVDPRLPGEIDELLDTLSLLEHFEDCGKLARR
jgi:4-hydroxy-tetrahydrodipicolinate synthase